MNAVAVEYFDERKGFWRIGYLEQTNNKWALVRTIVGRTVRIPIANTRELKQDKHSPN